jgi:hypothetical protein
MTKYCLNKSQYCSVFVDRLNIISDKFLINWSLILDLV